MAEKTYLICEGRGRMGRKIAKKMTPIERRIHEEIVKPVKRAAEKAFRTTEKEFAKRGLKCKLGKPKIHIITSDSKKPKIDIKKVAKGLKAEIIIDPKKIAEMKKIKHPLRPE